MRLDQRLPFLPDNVANFDWAANSLGVPESWSPELVTAASFVLESKFPKALVWGPDLITIYNDAFRPILGNKSDTFGRSFRHIWAEVWNDVGTIVDRAYAGEATYIEDYPLIIDRHGYDEQVYFTFCYSPVRYADGTVAGMIDTVIETTAAVQTRQRTRLLNGELGHRIKNMMAIVQAIASQSLKKIADRAPIEAFKERISALGLANDILLQTSWESASISTIVHSLLAAHGGGGGAFDIEGADVRLGPKAVLSLSMLLHELTANAAKYGALSVPDGRVALGWYRDDDDLVLRWMESGGPPATKPANRGFGSRIIDLGLLGTRRAAKHYHMTGFEAEFRAPFARLMET